MPRKVVISRSARADLNDARRWLLQPGSGAQGRARWIALRDAPGALVELPYKGAPAPEQPRLRQLVVSEYRVIYRVQPDTGHSGTAGNTRILSTLR